MWSYRKNEYANKNIFGYIWIIIRSILPDLHDFKISNFWSFHGISLFNILNYGVLNLVFFTIVSSSSFVDIICGEFLIVENNGFDVFML